MSIVIKKFRSFKAACTYLESLADQDYLFRGHTKAEYKLQSTLSRFSIYTHEIWNTRIEEMLDSFKSGLIRLGIPILESNRRLDWLEYTRHFGLPSPCIDLTYSPYTALFFAFNGVKPTKHRKSTEYSVIYALNVQQLASAWSRTIGSEDNWNDIYQQMLYPPPNIFDVGFPPNTLQFIPLPGKFSLRMQRQCGAFLYDTVQYRRLGFNNLEHFIEQFVEPDVHGPTGEIEHGKPILIKVHIDQKFVPFVFQKLEMMGISAGILFNNPEGVVDDVKNAYYYNAKIPYLRDVQFHEPANDDEGVV